MDDLPAAFRYIRTVIAECVADARHRGFRRGGVAKGNSGTEIRPFTLYNFPALPRALMFVLLGSAAMFAHAATPLEVVEVTARLRPENSQRVPIGMSVIDGRTLETTNTYTTSQLSQLVPSLNYTSPNPRNTALTIRGLGSSVVAVAQANDGLEPGVGFYVDQVYHARPATAAFDLLDLERVEVLRGPQGTLFGKNTTAGALNITTLAPTFQREIRAETSGGNRDFHQSRFSLNGPLLPGILAGRISGLTTRRDGNIANLRSGVELNDVENFALRAQLLFAPREGFSARFITDYAAVDSHCCVQVPVGVGKTQKPLDRQYPALAAGLGYAPPSFRAADRLTDIDAALKVMSHEGGASANLHWAGEAHEYTAITAWRFWQWNAANDRDYLGIPIQTVQGIPSRQDQYSQEFRLASSGVRRIDYTLGLFAFTQTIAGKPVTEYGPQAAYWLLGPAPATPDNLLDGYRSTGDTRFTSDSYAGFGELVWHLSPRIDLTGGLRYTWEQKDGRFASEVTGGLATDDAALVKKKLSILRPQSYAAEVSDGSLGGRLGASWQWRETIMPYVTWAQGQKSGGINMSGLPLDAANQPALAAAVVRPETNTTLEIGMKSTWQDGRIRANADIFQTRVDDFQANVVDTGPGALRGYLANIEEVTVEGIELDLAATLTERLGLWGSATWSDGEYTSYRNAPCPLEAITSSTSSCDLSGRPLPALPRWAFAGGAEYTHPFALHRLAGEIFLRGDFSYRSDIFGDATDSAAAVMPAYGLVNVVVGFRQDGPWELLFWGRNVFDADYLQNVTVQAGNSGLVLGLPGDPASIGVTVRLNL